MLESCGIEDLRINFRIGGLLLILVSCLFFSPLAFRISYSLEFKSKISNNKIEIPNRIQSAISEFKEKTIREIVLMDDSLT